MTEKAECGSDFRIVMIGKNKDEKTKLGMFLTSMSNIPYAKFSKNSLVLAGQWMERSVQVFNTSDLLSLDVGEVKHEIKHLVSQCPPGPNAFLLLVDPLDFSQDDREKLKSILRCFGEDSLEHSLLILTNTDTVWNSQITALKDDCGQRYLRLDFSDLYAFPLKSVMDKVEVTVGENQDLYDAFPGQLGKTEISKVMYDNPIRKPSLNIVLCGASGNWKAVAAKAILGKKKTSPSLSKSVKNDGLINGQKVSIIELPALSSLERDAARWVSLQCLSLCEPEGVHAFVMVQPVGPLNPEDKLEQDAIRREFTSKMTSFQMVLFAVDSEASALAVANFIKNSKDVRELCESCDNRYVIFKISDREHVYDLIRTVQAMSKNGSRSYRQAAPELPVRVNLPKTDGKGPRMTVGAGKEALRIVLIGKTGSGKSATANTILNRNEFESKLSQTSMTRLCRKAEGQIEGRTVVIVDTPGLFDTALSNAQVQQELVKCVSLLSPGPHVFLLVLQIGRFTKEEQETVALIQAFFGKNADRHTIVLFTRGDNLKNTTIHDYVKDGNTKELLAKCGNRYHVFNNTNKDNRRQVHELLNKIDAMVEQNGGGYYTSDIFKVAENAIVKETQRILQQKTPEMQKQRHAIEERHKQLVKNTKIKIITLKNKFEEEILQRGKFVREQQRRLLIEEERRQKFEERMREEERLLKIEEEKQVIKWNERYKNLVTQVNKTDQPDGTQRRMSLIREEFRKESLELERQREIYAMREEENNERFDALKSEYAEAKRLYIAKKCEDELMSQRQEQELRAAEESYEKELEDMEQQSVEAARRQAEQSNDFQIKYATGANGDKAQLEKELELMKEQQRKNDEVMVRHLTKSKSCLKDYKMMRDRQKLEIGTLGRLQGSHEVDVLRKGFTELKKQHEQEVHNWIQERVRNAADSSACTIL